ncbi:hypothetical protein, partial [Nocardia abscessus]|uniref:hypothetical protein n=1 Tax=Nocardia abscessus TaxID=120957 RepID=UPI0024542EA2
MAVTPGHPKLVPGESSAQAISRQFSESLGRDDTAPIDHEGKPDLLVTASVVALADRLAGEPVTDWVSQSVFVPDASARAVLTELDVTITETLGMLADVCARPQDRLDHTTELVRAGLARRVPPRGLTRLASHTADWAGIEYGTVHPLRLLTIRYTADVDFYENRVAAQLVDRLSSYVNRRLAELHVLAAGLADLDEYNQALGRRQSWRAQWRIAQLVSDVMADHRSSVAVVAQSIETLTKLRDSLGMLKGTPLLRRANRRIRLPMRLMRTNLFVQERRYRKVGQLWEGWATHETTAVEWQKQAEARFAAAYGSYVMIMTVRSLTVLGYALESGGTHSVRLRRHGEELTVSSGVEGTVTISTERGALARLLPITVDLSAAVPDHVRAQWVSYLSRDRTVIVV